MLRVRLLFQECHRMSRHPTVIFHLKPQSSFTPLESFPSNDKPSSPDDCRPQANQGLGAKLERPNSGLVFEILLAFERVKCCGSL